MFSQASSTRLSVVELLSSGLGVGGAIERDGSLEVTVGCVCVAVCDWAAEGVLPSFVDDALSDSCLPHPNKESAIATPATHENVYCHFVISISSFPTPNAVITSARSASFIHYHATVPARLVHYVVRNDHYAWPPRFPDDLLREASPGQGFHW